MSSIVRLQGIGEAKLSISSIITCYCFESSCRGAVVVILADARMMPENIKFLTIASSDNIFVRGSVLKSARLSTHSLLPLMAGSLR